MEPYVNGVPWSILGVTVGFQCLKKSLYLILEALWSINSVEARQEQGHMLSCSPRILAIFIQDTSYNSNRKDKVASMDSAKEA